MTKAQFFEAIQAELRKELIGKEAEGVGVDIMIDVHTKALANVVYDYLIKEGTDGKEDEARD